MRALTMTRRARNRPAESRCHRAPSFGEGELGAPAAGVEPPASLPGRTADPVGIAAGLADRGLDLLHEGSQARVGRSGTTAHTAKANAEFI